MRISKLNCAVSSNRNALNKTSVSSSSISIKNLIDENRLKRSFGRDFGGQMSANSVQIRPIPFILGRIVGKGGPVFGGRPSEQTYERDGVTEGLLLLLKMG